jgi:benzoate-CoA ligase
MSADDAAPSRPPCNAADEILGPPLARGQGADVAILCGEAGITFHELNRTVNRFASALRPYLEKGDRAVLLLKDSPVFVAAHLGIMRSGGVAVAISTRSTAKDLALVIEDARPRVVLLDEEFLPSYEQAVASCAHLPQLIGVRGRGKACMRSIEDILAEGVDEFPSARTTADDMAFWFYTSGTTGTPKAAVHCHGDVTVADRFMRAFGFGPGERVFCTSKLFFVFSFAHVVIGALRTGTTIVLYEGWPNGDAVADLVERFRPSLMLSVPAFYRTLLREDHACRSGFRTVRCYLSAGESLPESLYHSWRKATGVPIVEGIGTTETIFLAIGGTPDHHRPGATGKPFPWVEATLLDFDDQPLRAENASGILWLKMGSLCRGYWQQPEKTRVAFRNGWYRTGDVFTVDSDGWWHHQGRSDDLLKISGQWVSPAEIEECARAVAGVTDALVVGAPNEDGLVRLTLFLVAAGGQEDTVKKTVQEKLLATLSRYKCPRRIIFVDSIPHTATGKAQRFRLRMWIVRDSLARLLRAIGCDPLGIEENAPGLLRDMQRRCASCQCPDRCAADLDLDVISSTFQDYCPNADIVVSLRIGWSPS